MRRRSRPRGVDLAADIFRPPAVAPPPRLTSTSIFDCRGLATTAPQRFCVFFPSLELKPHSFRCKLRSNQPHYCSLPLSSRDTPRGQPVVQDAQDMVHGACIITQACTLQLAMLTHVAEAAAAAGGKRRCCRTQEEEGHRGPAARPEGYDKTNVARYKTPEAEMPYGQIFRSFHYPPLCALPSRTPTTS